MTSKPRKTGKPKALEPNDEPERLDFHGDGSLEEFVKAMHHESGPTENQFGMPTVEWLKTHYKTKSAVIRYLVSDQCPGGPFKHKDIAKHLGLRYQHVRNVAISPLKRGPNEDWRPKPTALPRETDQ